MALTEHKKHYAHRMRFADYDKLAPAYDRLHARFLRLAGGEAQAAMEGALSAILTPRLRVLDAGCGPGGLARRLLVIEPLLKLTLIDNSPRMIVQSSDLPVRRMHGSMLAIPLPDDCFDLCLALWSIETVDCPEGAIAELARLTCPGGRICLVFCCEPANGDWIDRAVATSLRYRCTGRMLDPDAIEDALHANGPNNVRWLACRGPARAVVAQFGDDS